VRDVTWRGVVVRSRHKQQRPEKLGRRQSITVYDGRSVMTMTMTMSEDNLEPCLVRRAEELFQILLDCLAVLWCRLSDGGLLVSIDGSSYTTYMREEVNSYRVIIGNKTCIFEKENDPTALRSGMLHTATAAALLCHRQRGRTTYRPRSKPAPTGFDLHQICSRICRLMFFTPVIHVITWINTHLPTLEVGGLSWPILLINSWHFTHKVVTWQP